MVDLEIAHMTTSQVGRVLDLSNTRIRQLAEGGRLPYVRTALGRLFDAEAVRALALEREQAGEHQVAEVA